MIGSSQTEGFFSGRAPARTAAWVGVNPIGLTSSWILERSSTTPCHTARMGTDRSSTDVDGRAAGIAEATSSINKVRAELRARRAARLADSSASGLPQATNIPKLEDLRSKQDVRWTVVERYILSTLLDDDHDTTLRDAAAKAAVEMETEGFKSGLDSRQWNTADDTRVHGVRIRLVKLILGLREVQQDEPTTSTLLPDVVFLERWTTASSIFEYHDRHWVRDRHQRKREEDEAPPVMLAFPDDGTTTMYELGKRVWMHSRR
ncbi:hypothetical protein FFLO_06330 [Filobasidium floriforme]|uniref:Uncharacterized protein n=1 Tax=Filobasidium floriforme TaxID=5210 RepID=A0A8K0JF53_9TREE|nr:uncharacterized protein HD553DRAFT_350476 [Filobasidium floriforme]KAG7528215.1 hypothetical protein FFLO_06330 [Filobasidium floriforme]KAH8084276.1 hypothetical protein HD553DRAFT_350476 [Filobasidium floriforme]